MKTLVIKHIKKIIGSELVSGSFYIFVGTTIASFIAFLFNLFFARNVSVVEYGIFASLVSLISLLVIPSQFLTTLISQFATTFFANKDEDKAAHLYRKSFYVLSCVAVALVIVFSIGSPMIESFLKIYNFWLIFLASCAVAVSYLSIVNNAFLQSTLRFGYIAINQMLSNTVKLLVGGVLIILGFKSLSGIIAVLISYITVLGLSGTPFWKYLFTRGIDAPLPRADIVKYSIPAFITVLGLSSFTTTDVILAKHFLSGSEAGIYAGFSLMGRVIFYFTAPIPSVMFPLVIKNYVQKKSFRHLFFGALGIVTILSLSVVLFYTLFPELSVNIFLGKAYLRYTPYLWLFGIYAAIFSILSVLVNFYLSLKDKAVAPFVGLAALAQVIILMIFHKTILVILCNSIVIASILLVILLVYYVYSYERKTAK